jgi:preprotein translocase subunit SecD
VRRRPVLVGILVAVGVPLVAGLGWGGWRLWRRETDPMGVAGGVRLVYRVDARRTHAPAPNQPGVAQRTADAVHQRIRAYNRHASVRANRDELEVLIPAVGGPPPMDVLKLLIARSGRIEFKMVDDGSAYMKTLAVLAHRAPSDGVKVDAESWSDPSGVEHDDVFFVGAGPEQLVAAVGALVRAQPIPDDHEILFERRASDWRTHYLFSKAHIDNADIFTADQTWSTDNGNPEVAIELTNPGGQKLAALSERSIGRKMAIVFEDRVVTAPVINARMGIRLRITLGVRDDVYELRRDAQDLVAVLRQQALPAPIILLREETVSPRE